MTVKKSSRMREHTFIRVGICSSAQKWSKKVKCWLKHIFPIFYLNIFWSHEQYCLPCNPIANLDLTISLWVACSGFSNSNFWGGDKWFQFMWHKGSTSIWKDIYAGFQRERKHNGQYFYNGGSRNIYTREYKRNLENSSAIVEKKQFLD